MVPKSRLIQALPFSSKIAHPMHAIQALQERGYAFEGQAVGEWSRGLHDGANEKNGFGRFSLDCSFAMNGEKALGWKGGSGLIRFLQHTEMFGSDLSHAAQLYSNLDAPTKTSLYELWVEQKLFGEKLRLKMGKIDAYTEFAGVEAAGDFLNTSLGMTPTILAFPTYPDPNLGAEIFVRPTRSNELGLGVFETGKQTLTLIEPRHNWSLGESELDGRASFGYWRLKGALDRLDSQQNSATQGFYTVLEQFIWRPTSQNLETAPSIAAFLQFGATSGDVSTITQHLGGGMAWQAPLRMRPRDSTGFGVTWVRFSSAPHAGFDCGSELIFENYYKIVFSPRLALVQDFQYMHHPGGQSSYRDYVAITPRLIFNF